MDSKQISILDYSYPLPQERIAQFPVSPRDHSRLLVYDGRGGIADDHFYNLVGHLPSGSLIVFNNTRVILARLLFHKSTGALIEVFLLEPFLPADYEQSFAAHNSCTWLCMVGNLKKWKEGPLERVLSVGGHSVVLRATRGSLVGTSHAVTFEWNDDSLTFADIIDAAGELPIPPYLGRSTEESDLTTYQTVYSRVKGSVAAPTAGLHFTPSVLSGLDAAGIERDELTLHVGAGTFKPVKSERMEGHVMHTEHICVGRHTLQRLLAHKCQATAVGTTSVRTLESLYYLGLKVQASDGVLSDNQLHVGQWEPYELPLATRQPSRQQVADVLGGLLAWMEQTGRDVLHASTQIIIAPGYEFKIVSRLVTNFHQPQSTLLLLVSAFTRGHWREVYDHALASGYRFLSYGDSSLLTLAEEE